MPTNKNAFTRIVILDKLLADRYHKYSIQDLTDHVNDELAELGMDNRVTRRCIEKDLKYLQESFPLSAYIDFEYTTGYGEDKNGNPYTTRCIRYADPTFSIFHEKLSEDEKGLLSAALSTLGSFEGLIEFSWLDDFCKRLGLVEQKPVILMSKNLNENTNIIAQTFSAIRAQSVIRLHYHTFADSTVKQTVISPYLLKEYNRRWFIIGAACDTGRILTFAADRVDLVEIAPEYKYVTPPDDLNERFEDIIGVTYYDDAEIHKITFWTSENAANYLRTKPIHDSQTQLRTEREQEARDRFAVPSGGALFYINCKENYELIRELCSYGAELKVLAPEVIVNKVKDRVQSMHDLYND